MDEPAHDQDRIGTVGADLRAAREARGLSLADIAERTRIPSRHIAAIEQGSYAGLPAATYSTGFVRTCARLLGLDPHDLSRRFRLELAAREPVVSYRQEPYAPADPARVPSRGLAWGTLALAVLLALGYLYWRGSRIENPTEVALTSAGASPAAVLPRQPTTAPAAPPQGTPGQTALLTAEQPVWLRITDTGGTRLFEGTLNPADHFQVPATATDPRLRTSRVTALKVTVGGVSVPPLGPPDTLVKDVSLKADALLAPTTTTAATAAARRQ